VTESEQEIIQLAQQYACTNSYTLYDFEQFLPQDRNHSVINAHFDNVTQFTKFIKKIKLYKGIYIETIYSDAFKTEILYASPYYLTIMDKHQSKFYKKNRRERSYSEDETIILKEVATK
jgi:hypothetical protein